MRVDPWLVGQLVIAAVAGYLLADGLGVARQVFAAAGTVIVAHSSYRLGRQDERHPWLIATGLVRRKDRS